MEHEDRVATGYGHCDHTAVVSDSRACKHRARAKPTEGARRTRQLSIGSIH